MIYQRREDIPTYHASGRERLEHLADFLEDLGPDSLTFGFWYGQGKGCAVGFLHLVTNPLHGVGGAQGGEARGE